MERLTSKEYWEENWKDTRLPSRYSNYYAHSITGEKILSLIGENKPEKTIEIGGCPGHWSDFFNRHFNCKCDVLEYGVNACAITKKNYELLGIQGEVFNQDIFHHQLPKNSYDVVISSGLVEHFSSLEEVFSCHLELVKKNGYLIISVPNLYDSKLYKFFFDRSERRHGVREVKVEEMRKTALEKRLRILYCGYLGVINSNFIIRGITRECCPKKNCAALYACCRIIPKGSKDQDRNKTILTKYLFNLPKSRGKQFKRSLNE